jgi:hypothetical protein
MVMYDSCCLYELLIIEYYFLKLFSGEILCNTVDSLHTIQPLINNAGIKLEEHEKFVIKCNAGCGSFICQRRLAHNRIFQYDVFLLWGWGLPQF